MGREEVTTELNVDWLGATVGRVSQSDWTNSSNTWNKDANSSENWEWNKFSMTTQRNCSGCAISVGIEGKSWHCGFKISSVEAGKNHLLQQCHAIFRAVFELYLYLPTTAATLESQKVALLFALSSLLEGTVNVNTTWYYVNGIQEKLLNESLADIEKCRGIIKRLLEIKVEADTNTEVKPLSLLVFLEFKCKALLHDANLEHVLKVWSIVRRLTVPESSKYQRVFCKSLWDDG